MTAEPRPDEAGAPPASERPIRTIAILGCGLIGGSLALAFTGVEGVTRVTVTDRDASVRQRARDRGIGHRVVDTVEEAARDADLVVIATPVEAVASIGRVAAACMRTHAVLTDVASVKSGVVEELEAELPSGVHFVGGHPMAGSEAEGIDAADGTLFQGATYLLTPTASADTEAFRGLAAVLRAIGARVLAVDAAEHDRLVASVSHLPQVLASALMAHAAGEARRSPALLRVAAGGFRDVTRVAGSNPDLWVGILRENRAAVLDTIDGFTTRLSAIRTAIDEERWDHVRAEFEAARDARRSLPSKETVRHLVQVTVPLADRPGMLAEVTTALGEAGVNIEDLSMRHASDGTRGALLIAVDGVPAAEAALGLLELRGYAPYLG